MSRTTLTTQKTSTNGLVPNFVAADAVNGMSFQNNGNTFLEVVTSGTTTNVTVNNTVQGPDGLTVQNKVVNCGATARTIIGPFQTSVYNQSDGTVNVDFSSATGVTVAAIRLT